MMFRRRHWAMLVLLLLIGCSAKPNPEPIQVAHLLPLTGPDKQSAEDARRGLLLAVEDINADDQRIAGRTVVVRHVDSHAAADVVEGQAARLATLNKVAAFIAGPDNIAAQQLVHSAEKFGVPVVV